MIRTIQLALLSLPLLFTGCVGWGPCGNECFIGSARGGLSNLCSSCNGPENCCNCDGYNNAPFGNIRRTLACGSGCGEIYYGEWASNPPNTCNECDVAPRAYGINSRIPWLCNPFRFWGFQYRPNGMGYGNPLRQRLWGCYGSYGRGPLLSGMGCDSCGSGGCDGGCGGGCNGGCGSPGGCAPNAPAHELKLKPIPKTNQNVSYNSPRIRRKYQR